MKFGKVLQQSMQLSPRAWEPFWVDYKLLKKIIKDCAQLSTEEKLRSKKVKPSAKEDNDSIRDSEDETNFFRTLREQIKRIATFFLKEQAQHARQIGRIEESFANLKSSATPKEEDKTELMKSCVSLYKELLLLENFAVMNFCGISKILKKHDKWTGYATRSKFMHTILMKQPFATYEPLLRMIDRLEQIFMATTGSTIEQHDAQNHSSRRGDGGSSSHGHRRHSTGTDAAGNSQHNPTHTPPVAHTGNSDRGGGGGGDGNQQQRRVHLPPRSSIEELSPRSDESITLVRVHALRSDVRELKKLESISDYDGDGENEDDDGTNEEEARFIYAGDEQAVAQRLGGQVPGERQANPLPPMPKRPMIVGEHHSDSDAAAMAMLSMKESLLGKMNASGASSDGGDSSSTENGRGCKRKAYSSLEMDMNKRKMSVTAILN